MIKIIYAITGYKKHGKDSLARFIKQYNNEFEIIAFAEPIKKIVVEIFKLNYSQVHDQFLKEQPFDYPIYVDDFINEISKYTGLNIQPKNLIAKCPRDLLKFVGSGYVRSIDDKYWLNEWVKNIENKKYIICPDLRFIIENEKMIELNATKIKIIKNDVPIEKNRDASELEQDQIETHYTIHNIGGKLEILQEFAYRLVNNLL